jgi:hypothetical protein
LAKQKSDPAAGTDSRLASTAVQPHCVTRQGTGSTVGVVVDVRVETSNFKSNGNGNCNCNCNCNCRCAYVKYNCHCFLPW